MISNLLLHRPKRSVGIEFTHHHVRFAAVQSRAQHTEVLATHEFLMGDGLSTETGQFYPVQESLATLVNKEHLHGTKTVLSVPNRQVIVRRIAVERVHGDLKSSVESQIGKQILLPIEDPVIDVYPVPALSDNEEVAERETVCIVACPRKLVVQMIDMVKEVGLVPVAVEVSSAALWRIHARTETTDSQSLSVLAHMDRYDTSVALFYRSELLFLRTQEFDEAFPAGGVQMPRLHQLAEEVDRAINFFYHNLSERDVPLSSCIVTPDSTLDDAAVQQLGALINRPVGLLKPLLKWRVPADSTFYSAIGLCMKEGIGI